MRSDRLSGIAARGHADAGELALLLDALGAPTKAIQRGAAETLAALARAGQPIEAVLNAGLADDAFRRRWGAVYAWSRLGPVPAACLPILLDALGDPDGDLRWASAAILRELGGRVLLPERLRVLLDSANPLQRKMALYCLRDLARRTPGLEDDVSAALDDPEPAVRLAAMAALPALADDRAAASRALVRRLDDADAGVRRAAAAALGRLGVRDAVVAAALSRAGASGDPALRRAAHGALAALGLAPA